MGSSNPGLVTVAYPETRDLVFDLDYYTSVHIPLCERTFGPYGLTHTYVADLRASPGPYAIQCTLLFENGVEGFRKAVVDHPDVLEDIKKFTNVAPVQLIGPLVVNQ